MERPAREAARLPISPSSHARGYDFFVLFSAVRGISVPFLENGLIKIDEVRLCVSAFGTSNFLSVWTKACCIYTYIRSVDDG
jgi:hypothetical protein